MLEKILTWVLQNRLKTLLTTVALTGSGYLTYDVETRNDVRNELSGVFDPYTKYQIRMDACAFRGDTLSIGLSVCNNGFYTLRSVGLKIDSTTVKLCNTDTVKFSVARQRNVQGKFAPMDSVIYRDAVSSECKLPWDPKFRQFKFCAPPRSGENAKTDSLCVHLLVKVYHSGFSKPDERPMHLRVPIDKMGVPVISAIKDSVIVL